MPTFGSLFSGIGGMDLGLERAGWDCKWQVELDDWRRQVLTRHWPEVPKWKDVREFPDPLSREHRREDVSVARMSSVAELSEGCATVDLICGGFPCQDLSVAGRRAGLAGDRSGLFFEFARIAGELKPRFLLIENVPGLLSANQGLDFAVLLDTLDELGYGVAWRICNSQYWGVPQRRRRVFIVGHLGSPCPPEILFESEGGGGDTQTGGETGEGVAASTRDGLANPLGAKGQGWRGDLDNDTYVADTLSIGANQTFGFSGEAIAQPLRSNRWGGSDSHGDEGNVITSRRIAHPLRGRLGAGSDYMGDEGNIAVCAPADSDGVREATGTPRWLDACSRCPDGRRYAALGDAVTVSVAEWIGRRIMNEMKRGGVANEVVTRSSQLADGNAAGAGERPAPAQ